MSKPIGFDAKAWFLTAVAVTSAAVAEATPQFAREYKVDCSFCHSGPPRLNQRGEDFIARGYRLPEAAARAVTVPIAVWNTLDLEHRASAGITKAFPSRVELISAAPIQGTRWSYFVEWRALSQQIGAGNRLLDRSGRFEDLFLNVPMGPRDRLTITAGQFRALNQVDVSRRLSVSEPLALSAGVSAATRARSARLTALRGFSPSGRQPAIRASYRFADGAHAADGWYASATVPLTGELTIPFTDAASFEFEARPKGVFLETYRRDGLTSIGGHAFLGDERRLLNALVTGQLRERLALLGAIGVDHLRGLTLTRYTVGTEITLSQHVVSGVRLDHRTGQRRDPAVLLFLNGHMPFGPAAFRQSIRLQVEQRVQRGSHTTLLGLSHIF